MTQTRVVKDFQHPCLACGAPWQQLEVMTDVDLDVPVWTVSAGTGECSKGADSHDPEEYAKAVGERRKKGWSS